MCFLSVLNASVVAADLLQPHYRHHQAQAQPPPNSNSNSNSVSSSNLNSKPNYQQQQLEQQNEVAETILQQILKQPFEQLDEVTSSASPSSSPLHTLLQPNTDNTSDIHFDTNTFNVEQLVNDLKSDTPSAPAAATPTSPLFFTTQCDPASSPSQLHQLPLELLHDCAIHRHNNVHNDTSSSAAACLSPLVEEAVEKPSASPPSHPTLFDHDGVVVSPPPACPSANTAPTDPLTSPSSTAPSSVLFDGGMCEYATPLPCTQRRSKSAEHPAASPPHLYDEVCIPPPLASNSIVETPPPASPWSSPASYRHSPRTATQRSASSPSPSSIPLVVLRALHSSRSRRENAKPHTPIRIRSTPSSLSPPSSVSPPSFLSSSLEASHFQNCSALPIAAQNLCASSSTPNGAVYIEHETDDDDDGGECNANQRDGAGEFDELSAMFAALHRMDDELKRQKQHRRQIDSWKRDVRRNWNFDIIS